MWPWAEAHGNDDRSHDHYQHNLLQCGRGPKPTEMPLVSLSRWKSISLQCGRGPKPTEITGPRPHMTKKNGLQCGRGPKPTEIQDITCAVHSSTSLQCGRGPKPTEMCSGENETQWSVKLQCGRGPKPTEIAHHADDPTICEPLTWSRFRNEISWKLAEFYITAKCTLSCCTLFGVKTPNCPLNRRGSKPS